MVLMGKFLVERNRCDIRLMYTQARFRAYPGRQTSAIAKIQVDGELMLTELGWKVTSRRRKGSRRTRQALCHYPREHYLYWARGNFRNRRSCLLRLRLAKISQPTADGSNVYMGDIFRWGESIIQVSQPQARLAINSITILISAI